MPFKSRRLQPYFGLGAGFGRDGFRGRRFERNDRDDDDDLNENDENRREIQGFAFARTGLNYVLLKRIIATAEAGYQFPFKDNNRTNGGLSLRAGVAYQFGKQKSK
jgi:hypothetical protein